MNEFELASLEKDEVFQKLGTKKDWGLTENEAKDF